MRESRVMVLIFSAHATDTKQIKHEKKHTDTKKKPNNPEHQKDKMPLKALEYFISSAHWLDAFPPPFETYLDSLVGAVRALLDGKPAALPRGPALARARPRGRMLLLGGIAAVAVAVVAAAAALA